MNGSSSIRSSRISRTLLVSISIAKDGGFPVKLYIIPFSQSKGDLCKVVELGKIIAGNLSHLPILGHEANLQSSDVKRNAGQFFP